MKKRVWVRAEVVVQIEFLDIRVREAPRHFRLLGCAMTIGPEELITRRPELSSETRFRGVFGVCCGPKSVLFVAENKKGCS